MNLTGELVECQICGRSMLVERALIGASHTVSMIVNCWDCLSPDIKKKAKDAYEITCKPSPTSP